MQLSQTTRFVWLLCDVVAAPEKKLPNVCAIHLGGIVTSTLSIIFRAYLNFQLPLALHHITDAFKKNR